MKIVITGASRGIGAALSEHFVKSGHLVWGLARSEDRLSSLKSDLGDSFRYSAIDLTNKEEVTEFCSDYITKWETVDILINNAGSLVNKPFLDQTEEDLRSQLGVNLMAPIFLIQELVAAFDSTHVINISSMGGYQGSSKFPGLSMYSAAKGALSILTECLQAELGEEGHTFNALCLGAVHTEMLETAFPGFEPDLKPQQMAHYIAQFALEADDFIAGKILPVAQADPG